MAYLEKCDMVWGADGNPVLLNGEFERRLQDEGLMSRGTSRPSTPLRRNSSFLFGQKLSRRSSEASLVSMDSTNEMSEVEVEVEIEREAEREVESAIEGEGKVAAIGNADDNRRRLVSRAGRRIRRMALNTGEIGVKIVALPTFVLLDMVS